MPRLPSLERPDARRSLRRCDQGATAIEYGLLAALIALPIIGAVAALGDANHGMWAIVGQKMPKV